MRHREKYVDHPRSDGIEALSATNDDDESKLHERTGCKSQSTRRLFTLCAGLLVAAMTFFLVISSSSNKEKVPLEEKYGYYPGETLLFSRARYDRLGTQIMKHLEAHAYAFAHNYTYYGLFFPTDLVEWRYNLAKQYWIETEQVLKDWGLADALPFKDGPPDKETPSFYLAGSHWTSNGPTHDTDVHYVANERWLGYIREKIDWSNVFPLKRPLKGEKKKAIVHVRRGDVRPCSIPFCNHRYMPNSFYTNVIGKYIPEDEYDIVIHSESDSFEEWHDFAKYTVKLDVDLKEVWREMMSADLLVTSKSMFSVVPALLNPHATVLFTKKSTYRPLVHWTVIDDDLIQFAVNESHRMMKEQWSKCRSM